MTSTWTDDHFISVRKAKVGYRFAIYSTFTTITGVRSIGNLIAVGRGLTESHAIHRAQDAAFARRKK